MRCRTFPLTMLCGLLACWAPPSRAADGQYDRYLWETPRVTAIDPNRTAAMVGELSREVGRLTDANSLAPLRLAYADLPIEAYWLYYERGRIITTLAWAYPHVSKAQQEGIRRCVQGLLEGRSDAPWTPGIKGKDEGATRQLNGIPMTQGPYPDAKTCPTLHVLYGLWLYGDRTGDWETLKAHWPQTVRCYQAGLDGPILYGQMGAHVAMARMGRRLGDDATVRQASAALERDLQQGRDIATIEARARKTRFGRFYQPRNARAFPGQPWVFLDASPEILRFIKDHLATEAIERIERMEKAYPLWWLHQAPYFTRWTGDEGIGLPSEVFGMLLPVERWVHQTPPQTLAAWMRSVPTGIGDCYWIESLVLAVESFGELNWRDVR